jgi:hypothetical protein
LYRSIYLGSNVTVKASINAVAPGMRSVPTDKSIKTAEKTTVRAVGFIATTIFYT